MENVKTIAISGSSGFIGSHLTAYFSSKGHKVIELTRINFEPHHQTQLELLIGGVDIVINLAGAPINKRWSKQYKQELYDSRINPTKSLVRAINAQRKKPELFISASAVGYYSTLHSYDEYITRKGDNFLANLCDAWEEEAKKVSSDVRLVIARLGIVIAPKGGAFEIISQPSRMKVSTIIGPGSQPLNWIDIKDVCGIIETFIHETEYNDVVNLIAPNRITNKEFTKKLAKHYKSILTITMPKFIFKILFGESSQYMCEGQRVKPTKLIEGKYKFKTKSLEEFFKYL